MSPSTPKTLQELHRIREQMTKEYRGLSTHAFVERTRHEVEALTKKWGLHLKQRNGSSHSSVQS